MSRNTPFSTSIVNVLQLVRSARRCRARIDETPVLPTTMPAATTATTPDACACSARRNATKGATSEIAVSSTPSATRAQSVTHRAPTTPPMSTPAATTQTKVPAVASPSRPSCVSAVAIETAVDSRTRAVASLTRPSPSRIVTMRGGSPKRLPRLIAATASGGETTAPSAMASDSATPGSSQWTTRPAANAESTTRTTDSETITRTFLRNSTKGTCRAAAYSSGGSTTPRMRCGSSSIVGMPGMSPSSTPTTTRESGAATPSLLDQ